MAGAPCTRPSSWRSRNEHRMTTEERPRLSVLIITRDAERLLDRVLESVRWADEIVIVDSGSTDETEAIARRHTEKFSFQAYAGHGRQRQRTLELSSGEWILYVDSDEIVTPRLAESIRSAVAAPGNRAGFRVELHTYFAGKWFGKRGWRKEWKLRLFRRGQGYFDDEPIHEGAVVDGPIGALNGQLLHYPYRDLEHLVDKMNRYSTAMAESGRAGERHGTPFGGLLRGMARFFRDYLIGGDFLYGGAGLVRSATAGYYAFLKYAKVWEKSISSSVLDEVGATSGKESSE